MDGKSQSQPRIEILRRGKWLHLRSPAHFEWTRVELPITNLAPTLDGLRILHLTDTHLKFHWWPAYDDLIERVRANPPDLILFTGDFVEHKWKQKRTLPILQRLIDGLTARLGAWGILGNHDGDLLLPHLVTFKLHLINRARTIVEANGDAIELIGIPGVNRLDLDEEFLNVLPPRDPRRLRIVLQHYPDQILRTKDLQADVVLAGHTHGGQICLPGGLPIMTHDSLPRQYCKGVHRFGESWLVVSRGMGFASIPVRLFCPPQAIEIVLTKTS
jgi:predicted MPP superfamily phosphohydrolase